jgi:hypothetical protein
MISTGGLGGGPLSTLGWGGWGVVAVPPVLTYIPVIESVLVVEPGLEAGGLGELEQLEGVEVEPMVSSEDVSPVAALEALEAVPELEATPEAPAPVPDALVLEVALESGIAAVVELEGVDLEPEQDAGGIERENVSSVHIEPDLEDGD